MAMKRRTPSRRPRDGSMWSVGTTVTDAASRAISRSSSARRCRGQWASSPTPAASAFSTSPFPATWAVTPRPCWRAAATTAASSGPGRVGPTRPSRATLMTAAPAAASMATAAAASPPSRTGTAVPASRGPARWSPRRGGPPPAGRSRGARGRRRRLAAGCSRPRRPPRHPVAAAPHRAGRPVRSGRHAPPRSGPVRAGRRRRRTPPPPRSPGAQALRSSVHATPVPSRTMTGERVGDALVLYGRPDGDAPLRLGRRVTLYVCGITPYDAAHVGHAFTYVAFDTLVRFLRWRGHEVVYCQNVTDVDDDMLRRAAQGGEDYLELGRRETAAYLRDMEALNVAPPTHLPKATEETASMIELARRLVEAGNAYVVSGNVFVDVTT